MDPSYVGVLLDSRYRATTRSGAKKHSAKKHSAKKHSAKKSNKREYNVRHIVASRKKGKRKILTQWSRYTDPKDYTWENETDLRGKKNDRDRKILNDFMRKKKKLAERIDEMNNAEVDGLLSEYDNFYDAKLKEHKNGKIKITVTTKRTDEQHTFLAHKHEGYVELETPAFWGRPYLFARAKLAVKMGEDVDVRESKKMTDKMGPCTYRDCLKDLVSIV